MREWGPSDAHRTRDGQSNHSLASRFVHSSPMAYSTVRLSIGWASDLACRASDYSPIVPIYFSDRFRVPTVREPKPDPIYLARSPRFIPKPTLAPPPAGPAPSPAAYSSRSSAPTPITLLRLYSSPSPDRSPLLFLSPFEEIPEKKQIIRGNRKIVLK